MPDPGELTPPPAAPGQAQLQALQGGGATTPVIVDFKAERTAALQHGGFSKDQIDQYWGDAQPPAPTVNAAATAGVNQAVKADPANASMLASDPLRFLAAGMGTTWEHYKTYLQPEEDKARAQTKAGMDAFSDVPGDPFSYAANQFTALTDFAGGAWQTVVAPFTAAVNEGPGKILSDIKVPDLTVHGQTIASVGPGGHLPTDWLGNTASTIGGFMLGGDMTKPPTAVPEATRYTAIDATRSGELPGGPAAMVDRIVPPDSKAAAVIKAQIPTADKFPAAAAQIAGPDAAAGTVNRITKNLQDVWAQTGIHPSDLATMAAADPAIKEEVVGQNIEGDVIAPRLNASRPPAPPVPKPAAAEGETFQNSVPAATQILLADEGSGAQAISSKGAEGRGQIMPQTAIAYGLDPKQLLDPAYNAKAMNVIVTDLYHRFNGDMEAMSIAYNAGPGRANEWLRAGAGTRLEAIRDNTMRTGWRYVRMAADRDESFLPAETQEYAARTRFRMGKPEAEPGGEAPFAGGPDADMHSPEIAQLQEEENTRATEEEREPLEYSGRGTLSSGSVWDDLPVGSAYEELAANIGDQRDIPPPKGLSRYDQFITQWMSRVQPAKAADDILENMGALNSNKEFGIRDAFAQVTKADWRASVAANEGPISWDGEAQRWNVDAGGPTAKAALKQAEADGGNTNDFMRWLVARRVQSLEQRNVNSGFNALAAGRIMRDAEERAKYENAAKVWDGYSNGVLDYAHQAGRYSADQIAAMKQVGSWVSFRRLMGDDASFGARGKNFAIGNPLKKMEGSDRQIVDPLLASLDNHALTVRSADANLATGRLIAAAEANPEFALHLGLKKADTPIITTDAIDAALAAYKIPEDQMEAAREAYGTLIADRQVLKPNQFPFFRDGQKETWETTWPELANMIRGSTPAQAGFITQVFQGIATAVRAGVVAIPDFAIRTFASHQMIQFINDPLHPPPFLTGVAGTIKAMGMHDLMVDAMANGALGTSMEAMDRNALYETLNNVLGRTGALERVRNDIGQFKETPSLKAAGKIGLDGVLAPLRMARAVQERLDIGNRVGLKLQGEARGLTGAKAGSRAAEAGIDYTNGPASSLVAWWSSMVPFMRPALLYTENAAKAIERNPAAYIGYATTAVTMPKVVLFGLNMLADAIPPGSPGYVPDADKYRNIPEWEKLYYYITPPIMGQRLKLRMPAFAGFPFGAVPEAIMQAMYEHDPVQFKDLFSAFAREYVPPFMPPAVKAPAETALNRNLDTWQPLTPSSVAAAVPELQYTAATSAPARALARVLGPPLRSVGLDTLSPIQIDHMITGYTGTAGQLALRAVNVAASKPALTSAQFWQNLPGALQDNFADLPFVHGFFLTHPGENGQIIEDYYDAKARFDEMAASKGALKREIREGDTSNLPMAGDAIRYAHADARLNKISHALTIGRDLIIGINRNPTMTQDEKRQQTEQVTQQMLSLAASSTKAMRDFK